MGTLEIYQDGKMLRVRKIQDHQSTQMFAEALALSIRGVPGNVYVVSNVPKQLWPMEMRRTIAESSLAPDYQQMVSQMLALEYPIEAEAK